MLHHLELASLLEMIAHIKQSQKEYVAQRLLQGLDQHCLHDFFHLGLAFL